MQGDLPQMVDVHCHVIYGVDDGARSFEDTQAMLRLAAQQGVCQIVCTSHATPGEERFHYDTYLRRIKAAQEWADSEGLGLRLYPGCEILYTHATPRILAQGDLPLLAGSDMVLVEFSGDESYDRVDEAVRKIGNEGYSVMIAHVERFACLHKLDNIRQLKRDYHVSIQMNAETLCMRNGFFTNRWVKRVLENELIDVVGSDAHNTTNRACVMREAYQLLSSNWGKEYADALCGGNARRLLKLTD